jgi:recombinational DNA repair protein (RecF pathway)
VQGYVLGITRVKDEDLVVHILTAAQKLTLYRFYGARHSQINVGFKLDFEVTKDLNSSIARLRNILHISFPWIFNNKSLLLWQQFNALFNKHLLDSTELDPFYFQLLESSAHRWDQQNPKRVAVEAYIKLLVHEGRLHPTSHCFLCEKPIEENIALVRAFLPTHAQCSYATALPKEAVLALFDHTNSMFLDDNAIDYLWQTLLEGL